MDRLLDRGLTCVTVLDVSAAALSRAKSRLAAQQHLVTWIEADVTESWRVPAVDVWHDRAVFHFLTAPQDRRRYVAHLRRAVSIGGSVVMATFAEDGPTECSGLAVMRYSPESLAAELGAGFALKEWLHEQHQTPFGTTQSFCYTRFVLEP